MNFNLDGVDLLDEADYQALNDLTFQYLIERELDEEITRQEYVPGGDPLDVSIPAGEYESAISAANRDVYIGLGFGAALLLSPIDEVVAGGYVLLKVGGNLVPAAVKLVDGVKKLVSRNGRTYDVPDATSRTGPDVTAGGRPIEFNGEFYSADGFKFSSSYYDKLWTSGGRPAPFIQARSIMDSTPTITPDPRGTPGYFRYEGAGMEMIYNPTTGQVGHIQPIR